MEWLTAAGQIIGGLGKSGAFGGGSSGPISTTVTITPRDRMGDYVVLGAFALAAVIVYRAFK